MRIRVVMLLGAIVSVLMLPGIGSAQGPLELQGTIQVVNCRAQAVTLGGPGTVNTLTVGPYTAVLINSASVPMCALRRYIGVPATAWLIASGNQFTVTRIDVAVGAASPPPPAYYSYYGPYYPYYGPYYYGPPWFGIGIVFGPGFHHHW
jgi:hypothetical protein